MNLDRRHFLKLTSGAAFGWALFPDAISNLQAAAPEEPPFKISLAEWSLNKTLRAGKMTNLDFPKTAKQEFGIDCIEFVDQFFRDHARDETYLKELKKRAEDEGVTMSLIMVDTNGPLGAVEKEARSKAVEKTKAWIDTARFLGCTTVRVNAYGPGNAEELRGRIAESCSHLAAYAPDIQLVIENHGRLSSDPEWLVSVMKEVDLPNFGTLPDFGNFPGHINRYDAVEMMMPFAKAVSAKATSFTDDGLVKGTDFSRMMRIVRDHGYHGYVGVESGASNQEGEARAVEMTRDLLKKIREQHSRCKPVFNGRNLEGWIRMHGGEWSVRGGELIGRNGSGWSTNPEVSGSWLSSNKPYKDFRLEFQFRINKGGNSGVFFRSAHEKNPAYTGYEMQVYGAPGSAPSKHGPGSIYDVAAPSSNPIRSELEWNFATLMARGSKVVVEMNGERILETKLDRSSSGYVGFQIHDENSEVRYKNIRIEEL